MKRNRTKHNEIYIYAANLGQLNGCFGIFCFSAQGSSVFNVELNQKGVLRQTKNNETLWLES
jgi:hypothetical protein